MNLWTVWRKGILGGGGVTLGVFFLLAPLPTWLLDIGVSCSWAGSVILLLAIWLTPHPLALPRAPIWLMTMTVGRLCLNIATTRSILNQGTGGGVIDGVGLGLMGGKWVVGVVFFSALMFIQYLVIARGVERIAQVSARFALDALPGAQQAISQAVDRGSLHSEEGRRARKRLLERSELCGSLDGVMRFIKGDALAAFFLVFINGVGGVIVGYYHESLGMNEALLKYTQLTIGDGLLAQLPSLMNAVAVTWFVTQIPTTYQAQPTSTHHTVSSAHSSSPSPVDIGVFGASISLLCFMCLPHWSLETRQAMGGVVLILFIYLVLSQREKTDGLSRWKIILHPQTAQAISSSEQLLQEIQAGGHRLGFPPRSWSIQITDDGLPAGGYAFFIDDLWICEGVIVPHNVFHMGESIYTEHPSTDHSLFKENKEGSFAQELETDLAHASITSHAPIASTHPRWGVTGYWHQVTSHLSLNCDLIQNLNNRDLLDLDDVALWRLGGLTPQAFIVADIMSAWRTLGEDLWSVEEVWSWLDGGSETLRGIALNADTSLIQLSRVVRALSREGVALTSASRFLEGVAYAQKISEDSKNSKDSFDDLLNSIRCSLGFEVLALCAQSESSVPYILIEGQIASDAKRGWSEDQWDQILESVKIALGYGDHFVILTSRKEDRSMIVKRLHLKAPQIPVLSICEVPQRIDLYQVAWVT